MLEPPWKLGLGALLLFMLCAMQSRCQTSDVAPAEIHISNQAGFDSERMNTIYFAACREVADELWPGKHRELRPQVVLYVGDKQNDIQVQLETGHVTVRMKKWSDETFAYAIVTAAHAAATTKNRKQELARAAVQTANATVSVKQLLVH